MPAFPIATRIRKPGRGGHRDPGWNLRAAYLQHAAVPGTSEAQRLLTGYDGQNAIGRIATAGRRFTAFADDLAGERRIGTFGEFKAAFRAASDAHGAAHA